MKGWSSLFYIGAALQLAVICAAMVDLSRGSGFESYSIEMDGATFTGAVPLSPQIQEQIRTGVGQFQNLCSLPQSLSSRAMDAEDAQRVIGTLQDFGLIEIVPTQTGLTISTGEWTTGYWDALVKAATFREHLSCAPPFSQMYLLFFLFATALILAGEIMMRRQR
ncbi:hypothetical protein ACG74X_20490 [Marivita sp. S0852]|uniref:hypothetical protein n=1 Tax=Marivita sp. S0852 TaxID=3373893 RepID=UPI003981A537